MHVLELDLHGYSHRECVSLTEDFLLENCNSQGITEFSIITGKSKKLQDLLIREVFKRHGFNKYYILQRNIGRIIVHNTLY